MEPINNKYRYPHKPKFFDLTLRNFFYVLHIFCITHIFTLCTFFALHTFIGLAYFCITHVFKQSFYFAHFFELHTFSTTSLRFAHFFALCTISNTHLRIALLFPFYIFLNSFSHCIHFSAHLRVGLFNSKKNSIIFPA